MKHDAPVAARPCRRWLQFRLRTLLMLIVIASLPLWAFNARLHILHLGKTGVTFEGANAFERDLPCNPIIR